MCLSFWILLCYYVRSVLVLPSSSVWLPVLGGNISFSSGDVMPEISAVGVCKKGGFEKNGKYLYTGMERLCHIRYQ